ncbi:MAG: PIN domain-containing protein [Candidatus Marinimicrobia bacterium]|nr:PIN domain-containing protein [Candidatus Neomarinimicrobiota bacterium]
MIYLDTHIVVWLYAGEIEKLSKRSIDLINANDPYISAIVRLELQYLYEIERITDTANEIIADLSNRIGLEVCDKNFNDIVMGTLDLSWTRDPFDRIIVANAAVNENLLITRDKNILKNYDLSRW